MTNPLNTVKELIDFVLDFRGNETQLNTAIYELIVDRKLSLDLFLEYQGITQTDVVDAFEKCEEEGEEE